MTQVHISIVRLVQLSNYVVLCDKYEINVRKNRKANQEWTIQKHLQHRAHTTQDKDKQNTKTQNNTEN